jgi:hypothetical protein
VPPTFDSYVWVTRGDRAAVLSRFIDRYVDPERPGDPRFDAFIRVYVTELPAPGDLESLAELRRDDQAVEGFSIYLHAREYWGAIITVTEEGALVLGLSLDDPLNSPQTVEQASTLMRSLITEFHAEAGVGGGELPPPQSAKEWRDEGLVVLREGILP